MTPRSFNAVAIFCGSNFGGVKEFADGARALGRVLGEARITVVYGGTTKGLMGVAPERTGRPSYHPTRYPPENLRLRLPQPGAVIARA